MAGPGAVRRIVNVSTDEVYGEASLGADAGLGEGAALEPTNPYSAAKAGREGGRSGGEGWWGGAEGGGRAAGTRRPATPCPGVRRT